MVLVTIILTGRAAAEDFDLLPPSRSKRSFLYTCVNLMIFAHGRNEPKQNHRISLRVTRHVRTLITVDRRGDSASSR